jgi:hypothetical protein
MFNVTEYNQILLFSIFVICVLVLSVLLKNKITTIIDPLYFNIFWIAGHVAFILSYMDKYGFELLPCFFLFNIIIHIYVFKSYSVNRNRSDVIKSLIVTIYNNEKKIKLLYFIVLMLTLISKLNFFKYVIENPNINSWFLYRFVDLQGRNWILRILGTGSGVYLYLFSFLLFFCLKKHKIIVCTMFVLMLNIFSGGRSSLLLFFTSLGMFVFYFNLHHKLAKQINIVGSIGVILAVFVAVFVSSKYNQSNISSGISIIINRVAASGDGLEYYMKYDGYEKIKSGPYEYFMSVFGIYVKHILRVEYKNIGTQLTELVKNEEVSFAQGSNYTFLLQVMVIGYWMFFIYSPLIAYIVMKLRYNTFRSFQWMPFSYFLSSSCFLIASDMEYAILVLISGFLVYFIILYPILKIKFR